MHDLGGTMSKITVALAQLCLGSIPSENYDKAEEFIEQAAKKARS